MIKSSYDCFTFLTYRTRDRAYGQPRRFLDEDNVKILVDFQQHISEDFVFTNILGKHLYVFQNYASWPLTTEQINLLLFPQSS